MFFEHLYQINSLESEPSLDNPNNVIIIPWIFLSEGLSAVCLKHFQVFPFCIQVVLELCLRSSFFVRSGLISSLLHSVWKSLKKFHLPPYKFCLLFRENVHIWIFEAKNFKVPELLPSKFKWDLFWGFANTAFFVLLEYYYPLHNFISSSASVFNSLWLHLINRECLTLLFVVMPSSYHQIQNVAKSRHYHCYSPSHISFLCSYDEICAAALT